jgi:predicted NAD/FAD-dependent oxidoreductase
MSRPQTIAVIGAGLSGLACAQFLQDAGAQVRVFDRAVRIGGRCATRRATLDGTAMQWDYGAQFVAASDPDFAAWITPRTDAWNGFRVGVPGMDSLPAALAAGLDILVRHEVLGAWRESGVWQLSVAGRGTAGTTTEGPFDAVAVALPAPLAARLLPTKLAAALGGVGMAPIWTGMLAFAATAQSPAAAHAQDGPLDWVFRDSDKPGRQAEVTCWSIQTGPGWSAAHADRPLPEVAAIIAHAFQAANDLPEPMYAAAHRWPHALVQTPLGTPCLADPVARIGACGDWCLGARLQDAWLSGRALGAALLA